MTAPSTKIFSTLSGQTSLVPSLSIFLCLRWGVRVFWPDWAEGEEEDLARLGEGEKAMEEEREGWDAQIEERR